MIRKYQNEVRAAEGRRQQASVRLLDATNRWNQHKRYFFTNPVNLLLPFTAGALLASRGSVARQAFNWSRAIGIGAKILLALYPFINKFNKRSSLKNSEEVDNAEAHITHESGV